VGESSKPRRVSTIDGPARGREGAIAPLKNFLGGSKVLLSPSIASVFLHAFGSICGNTEPFFIGCTSEPLETLFLILLSFTLTSFFSNNVNRTFAICLKKVHSTSTSRKKCLCCCTSKSM
jgi:hypothetical protein